MQLRHVIVEFVARLCQLANDLVSAFAPWQTQLPRTFQLFLGERLLPCCYVVQARKPLILSAYV
jgi:hypothetical protein